MQKQILGMKVIREQRPLQEVDVDIEIFERNHQKMFMFW